jgi:hypothetical protein
METSANEPIYARASAMIGAEERGTAVLLHTERWVYLGFDEIGTMIWNLLDQPRSLSALVGAMKDRFDVDEATCSADVKSFLDDMVKQDVVSVTERPAASVR